MLSYTPIIETKCQVEGCLGGKIWHHATQTASDCVCKIERERQLFLRHIPATTVKPYQSERFEQLDPMNKSLCFSGSLETIWALLRGELGPQHRKITVRTVETFEVAGYYGGGDNCEEMQDLYQATVVIFYLSGVTKSEKMNQIVRWMYQMRVARGKPVWFVVDKLNEASYEAETGRMLKSLQEIPITKYLPQLPIISRKSGGMSASTEPKAPEPVDPEQPVDLDQPEEEQRVSVLIPTNIAPPVKRLRPLPFFTTRGSEDIPEPTSSKRPGKRK